MSRLSELQEQALVVSTILGSLNPTTMHFNKNNYVIFGNYNEVNFVVPEKHKKHFGNQAILNAIAKVNGYKTYKSLIEDLNPKLSKDSMHQALELLNPYPLSVSHTQKWVAYIDAILNSLKCTPVLKPHTYQNFKKHEEAPFLNFVNYGFKDSYSLNAYGSLITVAESIYLTALKQPMTRITHDSYVPSENSAFDNLLSEIHLKGFKTDPFPFKECLNQAQWGDDRSLAVLSLPLKGLFEHIFNATLEITGKAKHPLEKLITVTFNDTYNYVRSHNQLIEIQSARDNLTNLQDAAQELAKEIGSDDVVYTHSDFKAFPSDDFKHNSDLTLKRNNCLLLNKGNSNVFQEEAFIKGTKLYWINIAPSLYPYPLVEKRLNKSLLSKDEIKAFIQTKVLDELKPSVKATNVDKKHKYHFRVKQEFFHHLMEEKPNIPEFFTVFSDYGISNEAALLMVHAEVFRLTNAYNKYYGLPNQVVSFKSGYEHSPNELNNPSQYEGLSKFKITRLKTQNSNYSYFVKFHPEALIEEIKIVEYDNESFPQIDINDVLWVRMKLVDCLIKKKLEHEEMEPSVILFKSEPNNFRDRENIPAKETNRLTITQSKELTIEEQLINQPYMQEIINRFIRDAILNLSMKNDLSENELPPYSVVSYPFSEHYVKNIPYISEKAVQIDIL